MNEIIWIIMYAVSCEALVQLWFNAAPLSGIRVWLIKHTPFLISEEYGNLFECRYCISVWIAVLLTILYFMLPFSRYIVIALFIHRISNHFHLLFSLLRDIQLDRRIARNRR